MNWKGGGEYVRDDGAYTYQVNPQEGQPTLAAAGGARRHVQGLVPCPLELVRDRGRRLFHMGQRPADDAAQHGRVLRTRNYGLGL